MVTIGSTYTGKTSFLKRYFKNSFENWNSTITVDYFTKSVRSNDQNIHITAYDTAGSEQFRSLTSDYVRDKHCIFFMFDLTRKETFAKLDEWYDWTKNYRKDDVLMVLIGSKKDEEREVDVEEARNWAREKNMAYFETSAKNNENIDDVF